MTGVPQDLDLGALLAEQSFVRRLARSLVYHDADVDDVTQQTFLRAVQRGAGAQLPARPFLARLVRGVTSNWKRSEGRRRRREAEAPAAEPAPAVADAFARESLRQEVVAELAALSEPYRSALVLRYFEDLQPAEVARRLGVPDGTARARLKRGLDALRERLDRRYGGDRGAWCTALLPLAGAGRDVTPLATGAAAAFGLHYLLLPAAALLLVVGLATWLGDDHPANALEGRAAPATSTTPATTTAAASPTPPEVRAPLLAETPPAAEPEGDAATDNGVRGRLVRQDGSPAPNVDVRLVTIDANRLFEGDPDSLAAAVPWAEATTASDADGRFLLRDVRPKALMMLQAGRGTDHSAYLPIAHTAGPDQVVDLGDVVLEARGTVRGKVEDEDGKPVAGAEVWFAAVPAFITLAANFERFAPDHGGMLLLPEPAAAEAPAAFAARTRSFLGSKLFMDALTPGPDTAVQVLDTPDWFARAWQALPMTRTTTGSDGTFVLRDVASGVGMLVARRAGLAARVKASLRVHAGEVRELDALTLAFGETCRGRVLDQDGHPVAGAAVRVASLPAAGFRGLAFSEAEVKTGNDGGYEVPGLGRGRVLVAARADGGQPWTTLGPVDVGAENDVRLPALASLRLHLPIPAAQVTVRLSFGPVLGEVARMGLRTEVDTTTRLGVESERVLSVRDLVPGTYLLEARAPDRGPVTRIVAVPGDLELDLPPAAPAFEVLVVSEGNEPLRGARVRCVPPADSPLALPILPTYVGLPHPELLAESLGCTDEHGLLRVRGCARGPIVLWADHPRFGRVQQKVELPVARVVLQLPSAATLRGVLTDDGRPASPARWRVAVEPADRGDGLPRPYALATLADDGSFTLTGLEPGLHRVLVQEALPPRLDVAALTEMLEERIFSFFGPSAQRQREVVLRAGEVRELRLDTDAKRDPPTPPLRLSGRVLVDGRPGAGLTVHVGPPNRGGIRFDALDDLCPRVPTDADGNFVFDAAPEGEVEVSVSRGQGGRTCTLISQPVALAPGANNEVTLTVSTANLRGRVLAPNGRTLDQASVQGRGPRGATLMLPTRADGSFECDSLPVGPWQLTVSGAEIVGPPTETSVELRAGADADVELQAEPGFVLEVRLEGSTSGDKSMVSAEHLARRSTHITITDGDGRAIFRNLRAGKYRLSTFEEPKRAGEFELEGDATQRVTLSARGVARLP